jgi:AcrR family transcriptional regulator
MKKTQSSRPRAGVRKKTAAPRVSTRKKTKRIYDNSSREQASVETRQLIIETVVQILTDRRGGEAQIEEVAKRSGISQRTIFRFFKDKKALLASTDEYLQQYLQSSMQEIAASDTVGFARNVFALFDKHEALVMAYLFSPFGQTARDLFRKKLNRLLLAQLAKQSQASPTAVVKKRQALIVSLINAKLWYDIKTDFGYSGREIGEVVAWAIEKLIANIDSKS